MSENITTTAINLRGLTPMIVELIQLGARGRGITQDEFVSRIVRMHQQMRHMVAGFDEWENLSRQHRWAIAELLEQHGLEAVDI